MGGDAGSFVWQAERSKQQKSIAKIANFRFILFLLSNF
jgi:hypothetical protein